MGKIDMNLQASVNNRKDSTASPGADLEILIEWRRTQIRALHMLRSLLLELGSDGTTAMQQRIAPPDGSADDPDVFHISLQDGSVVALDTRFFTPDERALLSRLRAICLASAIATDQVNAMIRKIRHQIDDFNQCNRSDFETLRVVSMC